MRSRAAVFNGFIVAMNASANPNNQPRQSGPQLLGSKVPISLPSVPALEFVSEGGFSEHHPRDRPTAISVTADTIAHALSAPPVDGTAIWPQSPASAVGIAISIMFSIRSRRLGGRRPSW
jgi:hypothetical protein